MLTGWTYCHFGVVYYLWIKLNGEEGYLWIERNSPLENGPFLEKTTCGKLGDNCTEYDSILL